METTSLGGGGGMFSGKNPAMLGLDLPVHQNPTNPHQLHPPSMVPYLPHEPHHHQQPPPPAAVKYPFPAKAKPQQSNPSDDEEAGFAADGEGKKKISPWQRMKWTDMMVRLLITAVFYIGDENVPEAAENTAGKKKPAGILQKKGKWKSVSRAMMEKGFYVSPQQCEDKFNDLNKRYKRVNDILGKGTACRVVENQTLLESMELTPKLKEEARKLLNSKHLFFREMCAYHNTCRHNSAAGPHPSPETAAEPSPSHSHAPHQQPQCFHAAAEGEEEEEENEEESEEDETEEESEPEMESRKRRRKAAAMEELSAEMSGVVQDGGRSQWEKKQWMRRRVMELEEVQVRIQSEGLELEKQRLKWVKFRSKKEREMERGKLENEKRRLENERMVLMVKQKELELMEIHHFQHHLNQHSSSKRGDPSSITG